METTIADRSLAFYNDLFTKFRMDLFHAAMSIPSIVYIFLVNLMSQNAERASSHPTLIVLAPPRS